jgi:biotin carboxyl carrier protein
VAAVTDPEAMRVSLVPAGAWPDIPTIVVEPDVAEADSRAVRAIAEGEPTVTYGLERARPDRLVLVDDADPPARSSVILGPPDGPGRSPGGARRTGIERREVLVDGWRFEVEIEPAARAALREKASRGRSQAGQDGPVEVRAIIPGVVVAVSVTAGDDVTTGQQLLVVEAMKMQNELRSPRDGVVGRIAVGERQTIEVGDLLVVIE